MKVNDEIKTAVVLSHFAQYSAAFVQDLVFRIGAADALDTIMKMLEGKEPPKDARMETVLSDLQEVWPLINLEFDLALLEKYNVEVLTPADARWPKKMLRLEERMPVALYVRGNADLQALSEKCIAIVGSRNATNYGTEISRNFSAELSADGYTICSGGAIGVDIAAHAGALNSGNVAFLGTGVDILSPSENARFLKEMLTHNGSVVSEYPMSTTVRGWHYLARNRLIAGLSDGVVIAEAAFRSGALSTATHAVSIGVPCGAIPGQISSAMSAGCHNLIRENAATLLTSPNDAIEMAMPIEVNDNGESKVKSVNLSAVERDVMRLFSKVKGNGISLRMVSKDLGLGKSQCSEVLVTLQLKGVIRPSKREGWYLKSR